MTITRFCGILLLAAAGAFPVLGGVLPIPAGLANATDYIAFNSIPVGDSGSSYPSSQLICVPAGCGGEFDPTISTLNPNAGGPGVPGASTTGLSTIANVFCVDYQLNVTYGSAYVTDIQTLKNITSPTDQYVQYGEITTSGGSSPSWSNGLSGPTTVDGTTDTNSAAYRYTLAAALVSQYVYSGGTLDGSNPTNLAIQEAVWYITANNTSGTDPGFGFPTPNAGSNTNYAYWLNYVLTNQNNVVTNVNLNQWAVVSGPANPSTGVVNGPANVDGLNSYQTFLVQVTPEPTFYGVLAIGLGGLFFAARRRTRSKPMA